MLAFNLKSLNNNASALIEARGQSASAGVRSALENVQDLHYYAESPLGHVMRYVLALTYTNGDLKLIINYLDDLLNISLVNSVLKTLHETWLNLVVPKSIKYTHFCSR
jgi:hypothetical protein